MQLNDELWCSMTEWLRRFWVHVKSKRHLLTWRYLAALALVLVLVSWGLHRVHRLFVPHGPTVIVELAERKSVPYTQDFVANTVAVSLVDIRARVEGFLTQKAFEEGADVDEGALIFEIDEAPFKAKLDQAQAQLAQDEAALAFANEQVKRYAPLASKDYVSREDYDNYRTKADEARAAVEADRAAVEQASLNLGYCKMYSPISGRIGRMLVNVGNLVGAGQDTQLATIVQLDPMYLYFAPSSRDAAAIIERLAQGKIEVEVIMPDGKPFAHKGPIDFVNNTVDQKTSTVSMRAVIPNPEKTLLPGLYLQARVDLGEHPDAVLVPEQAIAEDQQGSYVMIVKSDNTVEQRHVTAGDRIEGARIVDKGIDGGELVIVSGLQLVRPGSQVTPRLSTREPGMRDLMLKAVLMPPKK